MKDNVADFLDAIVESNFDRLEALMLNKYKQFLHLYWMLKSYASDIRSLKYSESEKNTLIVAIDVTNEEDRDRILYEVSMHDDADSHPEGKNKIVIHMIR